MYIGVTHDIKDPKTFWGNVEKEMSNAPKDVKLVRNVANKDGTKAFCLWEADSVENVKNFLESKWGPPVSNNDYYEVDPTKSNGLPTPAAAK